MEDDQLVYFIYWWKENFKVRFCLVFGSLGIGWGSFYFGNYLLGLCGKDGGYLGSWGGGVNLEGYQVIMV